jgi:hypothetical protein
LEECFPLFKHIDFEASSILTTARLNSEFPVQLNADTINLLISFQIKHSLARYFVAWNEEPRFGICPFVRRIKDDFQSSSWQVGTWHCFELFSLGLVKNQSLFNKNAGVLSWD